jgi:3-oxoacyl-[acyl-carrier protein] reductase
MTPAGLMDLTGKVVLVTGGSRGIGAATARLFARAGARVAVTYRTRKADADRLVGSLAEGAGTGAAAPFHVSRFTFHAYQSDLTTATANDQLIAAVVRDFGALDYFVANAGVWAADDVPLTQMTDGQWRTTMAANLDAVFFGCRAALRVLRPDGAIVIVSSTAGQRGEAFHADYAASKGAVIAFTKSLAGEAAPGIRVNAVAPGWVDTEMCAQPFAADGGVGRGRVEAGIPLGRIASPEDLAGPIVFLCSALARHVTGEVLNVNGGSVLCG